MSKQDEINQCKEDIKALKENLKKLQRVFREGDFITVKAGVWKEKVQLVRIIYTTSFVVVDSTGRTWSSPQRMNTYNLHAEDVKKLLPGGWEVSDE